MIHVVGDLRVDVAQWIIRESSEMDHRVEAAQVFDFGVAYVLSYRRNAWRLGTEVAGVEPAGIHADDVVAGLSQHRCQHRTDVAEMACDQNPHPVSPSKKQSTRIGESGVTAVAVLDTICTRHAALTSAFAPHDTPARSRRPWVAGTILRPLSTEPGLRSAGPW